jgi:hypothetical protein
MKGLAIFTMGLLTAATLPVTTQPATAQSGSYSLGNGVVSNSGVVINTGMVENSIVNDRATPPPTTVTTVTSVVQRFIPLSFEPRSHHYRSHRPTYRPTFSLNFQFNAPIVALCTTRDTIVSSNGTVFRSETTEPCH